MVSNEINKSFDGASDVAAIRPAPANPDAASIAAAADWIRRNFGAIEGIDELCDALRDATPQLTYVTVPRTLLEWAQQNVDCDEDADERARLSYEIGSYLGPNPTPPVDAARGTCPSKIPMPGELPALYRWARCVEEPKSEWQVGYEAARRYVQLQLRTYLELESRGDAVSAASCVANRGNGGTRANDA